MALHVQQFHDDVLNYECDIPVPEGTTDAEYLEAKAASAQKYGWHVERTAERVEATKLRWHRVLCRRIFEVR